MLMTQKLKDIYRRQGFFPGWLGIFINPFFLARSGLRDAMVSFAPRLKGRLLDVGCGSKPYQSLFTVETYIGLDIDDEVSRKLGIADHLYDGNAFPFTDGEFDSVLCNQVLEHVFNPDVFLAEINRVLKSDGKLLLTVPFVWDEHSQPYDYARYSSFGLYALFAKAGFKIIQHQKLGGDVSIIFQLVNAYLFKVSADLPRPFRFIIMVSVMSIFNLLGLLSSRLLPANPDLFLDHVVLAEKAC